MQLNTYEKPFHPEIAGGVREMLFEPMSPVTAVVIARKIEDVIKNFEPRARLVSVRTFPDFDRNRYYHHTFPRIACFHDPPDTRDRLVGT